MINTIFRVVNLAIDDMVLNALRNMFNSEAAQVRS